MRTLHRIILIGIFLLGGTTSQVVAQGVLQCGWCGQNFENLRDFNTHWNEARYNITENRILRTGLMVFDDRYNQGNYWIRRLALTQDFRMF